MSHKQSDGKLIKNIFGIAIPATVCAATALYIATLASYDVAVRASIGGVPCGYVESCAELIDAKGSLEAAVHTATDGSYDPDINITYDLVHVMDPVYLTAEECAELMWAQVEDDFCEAYMLYVDDRQAAAYESGEELNALIKEIESELLTSTNASFGKVEITNRVQIKKQLCLKSMLKSIDEINELLNPLAQHDTAVSYQADESEGVTMRIGALRAASPESIEDPNIDYGLTRVEGGTAVDGDLTLDYNFVNTVTLNETIYYKTERIDDYDNFIGTDTLITEGVNGEKTVTYEIVYDSEGNIIARNILSETIITPAVNKIIKVGATPIPEAVPTGTFKWPCATPKGISSPYGWRVIYGKKEFHLGIDLPDAKGSPIYASDGGEIVWAGYTPSYGYSIRIEHADGYMTLYAHLSEMLVSVGDKVYQGQQIGKMGSTGMSYGSHLHFEVRINNQNYDPEDFLPELVVGK